MRSKALLLLIIGACAQPRQNPPIIPANEADAALQYLVPRVRIVGAAEERYSIRDRMQYYGIPGVSIALIENGKIQWTAAFGEGAAGHAATPNMPFMTKSVSKPLTAFAVMRLAERGVFNLDSPVDSLLVRWHLPKDTFATATTPTIRQVLNHSAGFNMFGVPSYEPGQPLPTLIQALNGTPPAPPPGVRLVAKPGDRTSYSGGGYSVLQALLEDVARDSFPNVMRTLVLEPLEMRSSGYYIGMPAALESVAAVGHKRAGQPLAYKWEGVVQMAAGGLISTASDVAKFVIEMIDAHNGKSRLINKASANAMLTATRGWGLGFEVQGAGDSLSFSHTGSGDGFKAVLASFPSTGQGAVILTNSDAGGEFRNEVLRSLSKTYKWPGYKQIERRAINLSESAISSVTGRYVFSDKSIAELSSGAGGAIVFKWGTQSPSIFWAESDSVFFNAANEELRFDGTSGGMHRRFTWSGSFGAFAAVRGSP